MSKSISKKDQTEKLILTVQKYPIMYDMTLNGFKDVRRKDYLWDTVISQEMDGEKGESLKTKWKSLRDNYQKHMRANDTRTGQAASASKGKYLDTYKNWIWAKHMEFLKPHLSFATTMSNVQEEPEEVFPPDDSFQEELLETIESSHTELKRKKSPQHRREKNNVQVESNVDKVLEHLNKKQKVPLDAFELMMLSHAKTIKTFSPRRQAMAKKHISDIMTNLELEQIEENEDYYRAPPLTNQTYQPLDDDAINLSTVDYVNL